MAAAQAQASINDAPPAKKKRSLYEKMAVRSFFAVVMAIGLVAVYNFGHAWLCAFVVAVQVGAFVELTHVQHDYYENEHEKGGLKLFRSLRFAWLAVALYVSYGMSWMAAPFEAGQAVFGTLAKYVRDCLVLCVRYFAERQRHRGES